VEVNEEPVTVLGEGSYFGEIGLLRRAKRSAAVRALTNCEVCALAKVWRSVHTGQGVGLCWSWSRHVALSVQYNQAKAKRFVHTGSLQSRFFCLRACLPGSGAYICFCIVVHELEGIQQVQVAFGPAVISGGAAATQAALVVGA
jgi:Cyclic nucleotide-binding domain